MATKAVRLPSGSWRARVQVIDENGKRRYKSFTAETRKEAALAAAKFEADGRESVKTRSISVGGAIDAYIENRSSVLSPSTVVGYKNKRRNYLQSLMVMPLSALTPQLIQRAVNQDAPRVSSKTLRCAYGVLTATLAEYRPDLDLRSVNLPAIKKTEINVPNEAAVEELVKRADGSLLLAVLLGAFGGLRRSEIGALTKSDLDIAANRVSVTKALVKNDSGVWVEKQPKSYAGTRSVALPPNVMRAVEKLSIPSARYIVGICPDTITKRFIALRNAVGLKCRFHDLRHYTASILLSLGVPDKYAMEIMGHATPGMLKNVYQHTFTEKRSSIDQQITAHFTKCATKCATPDKK